MTRLLYASLIIGLSTVHCFLPDALADELVHKNGINSNSEQPTEPATSREPEYIPSQALSLSSDLTKIFSNSEQERIRSSGPWLTDKGFSYNAQQLLRAIQDAHVHGLNPESYGFSEILIVAELLLEAFQEVSVTTRNYVEITAAENKTFLQQELNKLLDDGFIKLATHLGQGVVDGRKLEHRFFRELPDIDANGLLESLYNAEQSVADALASVRQAHPDYIRLTRKMRDLMTEQATGVARTKVNNESDGLPVPQSADSLLISNRLLETGDLSFAQYLSTTSDTEVLNALHAFQARLGLEISDVADEVTRKALNRSLHDDITSVALSLERWRWLPRDLGKRHVYINIPDFQVELIDNHETTLSMRTVVGSTDHPTPSFSRNMTYMEYNPTWTVPGRIKNEKLIPRERRSPGYLASRNFEFLKRGKNGLEKVAASTVSSEDFKAKYFPYILRQRGGSGNALGRMKFMMPNQHAIYMHDTPAKSLFGHHVRAYSNGCVRLEDPDALAQHLMLSDGYSQSDVDRSMRSRKTHRVRFRQPIPTHYVYMTTWVDVSGALQIRPDVYSNDGRLEDALRASDTLLSLSPDYS